MGMKHHMCFVLNEGQKFAEIKLIQTGIDKFRVTYGLQVKDNLNYDKAALELGAAIMHHLACKGELDNREKGER